MRYVQILIPEGKRDAILGEFDTEHIDYAVTEETGAARLFDLGFVSGARQRR